MAQFFPGYQSPDDIVAESAMQRRAAEAAALRQRSVQSPQAYGDVPVVSSPLGLALRGVAGVLGKRESQAVDRQAYEYAQQKRQRLVDAMRGVGTARTPDQMQAMGERLMPTDPNAGWQMIQQAQAMRRAETEATARSTQFDQQMQKSQANFEREMRERREQWEQENKAREAANAESLAVLNARLQAELARGGQGQGGQREYDGRDKWVWEKIQGFLKRIEAGGPDAAVAKAEYEHFMGGIRAGQFYQAGQGPIALPRFPGQGVAPVPGQGGNPAPPAAQYDPGVKKDLAYADTVGKSVAEAQMTSMGVEELLDQARAILTGQGVTSTGEPLGTPTQSGLGVIGKKIGELTGYPSSGAPAADALAVIGGALVSKVPRMQGAQSNFDVQQYQIMAGRIGDPGVPIAQRLAALDQIPRLWAGVQRFMAEQAARGQTSPTAPAPEINLDEVDAIVGGQ